MALTLLKMVPKKMVKGKAIIVVISGNWLSSYSRAGAAIRRVPGYIDAGYTLFLVMHGSQPRYSIADQVEDLKRAVRFVRYNAAAYGIDSNHIGITGASSGGHLSLMTALSDETIIKGPKDPVDAVSSRVQAAAVFFPPTDFLHWGAKNTGLPKNVLAAAGVAGAFDFKKLSGSSGTYERLEEKEVDSVAKAVSPIYLVSSDDPPVFITHGDADIVVPLQQSQTLIQKLKDAKVPNQFVLKPGAGHGWRNSEVEEKLFVDWFDKYLR